MEPSRLEVHFDGQNATTDARAFAAFLEHELPELIAVPVSPKVRHHVPGQREVPIAIAVIALVLSIPTALKNAIDVSDRLQLGSKIARLVAWAKERRERGQRTPTLVLPLRNKSTALEEAIADEVIDALVGSSPGRHDGA